MPVAVVCLARALAETNIYAMLSIAIRAIPGLALGYGLGRYLGYFGPLTARHTLYVEQGEVDFADANLPAWKHNELLALFAEHPRVRGTFSIMPDGTVWIARTIPIGLHQPIKNIICA